MDSTIEMVITDWNMPNMGGLDLVKHLRGNPKTAKTPILMVTTRSVKEDILQALEAGVNSYILKPFTPQVLKEKLDQVSALASGSA
jgi:two-component system chemotaxis response regulator CheY